LSAAIKAVALDVDGVLTDGTVWLDDAGRETKRVSFADIMGVSMGRRAGLQFALVSGESGPCLDHIAAKFGIGEVYGGCKDKAAALSEFAMRHDIGLDQVCFIGDDVNDLAAMQICGLAVVPPEAHAAARLQADLVTTRPAGGGAVREIIDAILAGEDRVAGVDRPTRQ
jgi:3-deoxy-D-manno-octulosonate 8-phosphate phosphatase (KDO 8-P phosphatase)